MESHDIGAILAAMTSSSKISPIEYRRRTIGGFRYLYYYFLHTFRQRPISIMDLVDGMSFMDALSYQRERAMEKERAKAKIQAAK